MEIKKSKVCYCMQSCRRPSWLEVTRTTVDVINLSLSSVSLDGDVSRKSLERKRCHLQASKGIGCMHPSTMYFLGSTHMMNLHTGYRIHKIIR